jgi:pimeloyl-ACP methyl ester carboxylesterase
VFTFLYLAANCYCAITRGAHGSAGRTSWTAKAESADYMSVVGFVSHYVHFLDPFRPTFEREPTSPGLTSVTSAPATPLPPIDAPILLFSGYSYGAMVTTNLPSLETVLAPFNTPIFGSPPAEIRLRAQHLAETQNAVLASARAAAIDRHTSRSPRKSLGLRIGGDEENRKSHDSRRSISSDFDERLHKGVTEFMAKARKGNRKNRSSEGLGVAIDDINDAQKDPPAPEHLLPVPHRASYRPSYLLVSPLQGVVTSLATMSFGSPLASLSRRLPTRSVSWSGRSVRDTEPVNDKSREPPASDAEQKLVTHPTLAIYGDRDSFVPVRKLREWVSRLEGMPSSKFRGHEVSSAGHFWAQGNVAGIMRDAVKTFAESVLRNYDV